MVADPDRARVLTLEPPREVTHMKSIDVVVVSRYRSVADAHIAKGILDEHGIEAMIRSDNVGGMYPALSVAEVLVRSEDVERATAALMACERCET